MIMDKCPVCSKHVLQHAKQISYCIRFTKFHMKCLSLKPEDHDYLQVNAATWYCVKCTSELFPFNHFVDDDTFVLEANQIDVGTKTIESLSELIFNPFELNDDASYYPLGDIDPDANFFQ